jgi:hypothetical protein
MPEKEEYPPLLGSGFHVITLSDLRKLCVDGFPLSTTRNELMRNLEKVYAILMTAGVVGDLWIDGSFLTKKIDPRDVDLVLRVDSAFYEAATEPTRVAIRWVGEGKDLKPTLKIDNYGFLDWPPEHPAHKLGEQLRRTYIKRWGISEKGVVKGIAVVRLESA